MEAIEARTGLKNLKSMGVKLLTLVPGAGLEPARTLAGPRDFKSRASTNFAIRAAETIEITSVAAGIEGIRRLGYARTLNK
jgi:hypothetical protein